MTRLVAHHTSICRFKSPAATVARATAPVSCGPVCQMIMLTLAFCTPYGGDAARATDTAGRTGTTGAQSDLGLGCLACTINIEPPFPDLFGNCWHEVKPAAFAVGGQTLEVVFANDTRMFVEAVSTKTRVCRAQTRAIVPRPDTPRHIYLGGNRKLGSCSLGTQYDLAVQSINGSTKIQ